MTEFRMKEQIVAACRRLYQRNCLASADGNISVRSSEGRILITPSGVAKAFLDPQDMAVLDEQGQVLDKKHQHRPSGESPMHLAIYQHCPQARAIVHAHPPHAVAWSVVEPALQELPGDILSEVILAAGKIPIVPYACPTTMKMGENLLPYLPDSRLMILERHGAVAWGESLDEAVGGMERLEHAAQILWLARTLGPLRPLPDQEAQALWKMRSKMGSKLL